MRGSRSNSNPNRFFQSKQQPKSKTHVTFLLTGKDKIGISISYSVMTPALKSIIKEVDSVLS